MIQTIELGGATIAYCEIEKDAPTRRAAERAAVDRLVSHLLPGRTLSHLPSGAPTVGDDTHISVSHSRRLAVVAISPLPIGVDAEEDRPTQLRRVAPRVMTEAELAACPDLLLAWTAKEAAYKAVPGLKTLLDVELLSPTAARAGGIPLRLHTTLAATTRITLATPALRCN